jgi:hypothetical protein
MKRLLMIGAAFVALATPAFADNLMLECPVTFHVAPPTRLDNQTSSYTFEISIANKWAKESSPGVPAGSAKDLEITNTQYVIGVPFDAIDKENGWKNHFYATTINRMTGEIFEGSDSTSLDDPSSYTVRVRGVCHTVSKQQF